MQLALKSYRKMWVFQIKIVPDTTCCRSKFKILRKSVVICAHFNNICISIYHNNLPFLNYC
jgi:hypothetical protein